MSVDKTLKCVGCGREFIFRAIDQDFFKKMVAEGNFKGGYTEPKRCFDCREEKKKGMDKKKIQDASPFKPLLDQFKKSDRQMLDEDEYRHEREEPSDFSGVTNEDR